MKLQYLDIIQNLEIIFLAQWHNYTDENLKMYAEGFFAGIRKCVTETKLNQETKKLEKIKTYQNDVLFQNFLKGYLLEEYGINAEKNSLIIQIDHYAFLKDKSFKDGFGLLLREIKEIKNTRKYEKIYENCKSESGLYWASNFEKIKIEGDFLENIILKNGLELKIGDFLELSDKMGDDFKKTYYFDKTLRNPSWELFYPSKLDFQHIDFCFEINQTENQENTQNEKEAYLCGKILRIFSGTINQIKYIIQTENTIFVYTDLFKIDIEKAFEKQECKIIANEILEGKILGKICERISDYIENYEFEYITKHELYNQIWGSFWQYFIHFKMIIKDSSYKSYFTKSISDYI